MFKLVVCLALIATALAVPEPSPKAKPGLLAATYAAPVVAAPAVAAAPVAYSAHYAAPLAYSAGYVAPSVYSAAYSPYAARLVVV